MVRAREVLKHIRKDPRTRELGPSITFNISKACVCVCVCVWLIYFIRARDTHL